MKALFASALILAAVTSARADFYTYSQWESLPPTERLAYVSGAFDSYVAFSSTYKDTAARFVACLGQQKMTNVQLATNVMSYASGRSDLQSLPVAVVVVRYLAELCGPLP